MARRKQKVRARKRTGIAGAPTDGTFRWFLRYLHYDVDSKEYAEVVKNYVKRNYSKDDAKAVLAVPTWEYANSHTAGICYWASLENEFDTGYEDAMVWLKKKFDVLKEKGLNVLQTKVNIPSNKFVVTPLMRQQARIYSTVMEDLYQIEENWELGIKYDLYTKLQIYDIKRFVEVEAWINEFLVDYKAVVAKDEYMMESYAHIPLDEIKNRIVILERFESEVTNMKVSKMAVRKVRAKTRKGADKQILNLKYQKESSEFQLTSINPMRIPGAMTLYVFNTKYRQLTVYVSNNPDGLLVSGSTVKGFDQELSQVMTLRKPSVTIPEIMKKTPKQVTKLIDDLKVAKKVPTGRINTNTIILKAK